MSLLLKPKLMFFNHTLGVTVGVFLNFGKSVHCTVYTKAVQTMSCDGSCFVLFADILMEQLTDFENMHICLYLCL